MAILIFSTLYIFLFIVNASAVIPETADALRTFLFIVLPSIFPICVLSDWLVRTGAFYYSGKIIAPFVRLLFRLPERCALPIIIGVVGSYPGSAKATGQLYAEKQITRNEAVILSTFTNNAGPLFVIGVVGTSLLQSTFLGCIIWAAQIGSGFIVGAICSRIIGTDAKPNNTIYIKPPIDSTRKALGKLPASIADSAQTMVTVTGTILFFAALCASIECIQIPYIGSWIQWSHPIIEMTSGCQMLSGLSLHGIHSSMQLAFLCSAYAGICTWGGLSVHLQIMYILSTHQIPLRKFILGKCLHTVLSAALTFILIFYTI